MRLGDIWQEVVSYASQIDFWEFSGLIFGLLAVYFLIRESIWTWPSGISYVVVSFVVFWQARLYGDFLLHIFFLILNVYGWYYWICGNKNDNRKVAISQLSFKAMGSILAMTILGVLLFAQVLIHIPDWFAGVAPAALPYWDSTTSVLSVTAMWLTARKKIENWYYWFVIDVLATGIYFYKGLYFYALLYFVYIGMAVSGYLAWRKTMIKARKSHD